MEKVMLLNKSIGITPLDAIKKLKQLYPEYARFKLGYAGRLDPMAEGLLLILVGEENKKRKEYERLTKEYELSILLGLTTDTYDILGLLEQNYKKPPSDFEKKLRLILPSFIGKNTQAYPPYSSPRVCGKALFWWAREGRLREIVIPKKRIEIYSLQLLEVIKIDRFQLQQNIKSRIGQVKGDFRQAEILRRWNKFFLKKSPKDFLICKIKVSCSSGVYMRTIAHEIGKELGCFALAYSINRTRIGDFTLSSPNTLFY